MTAVWKAIIGKQTELTHSQLGSNFKESRDDTNTLTNQLKRIQQPLITVIIRGVVTGTSKIPLSSKRRL